jgi:hypothetical protein
MVAVPASSAQASFSPPPVESVHQEVVFQAARFDFPLQGFTFFFGSRLLQFFL